MNPEIKIERLYESVMDLMNTSSSFLQEETFEEEENLRKVLRKIIISKTLYEKNIIAISGLQGVGKSTIIKNFYELDESALPIVAGRGERIPILITETSIVEPEAYAILNRKNQAGKWVNEEVEVSWDHFKRYARGEDMSAMILGVRVPYKHFNNSYTSFLVLPGFEGSGEDYWETLIDFSLTSASTVIFAVNEAKMADQQNKERVEMILSDFKGIKPIFAMTFADQSKDQNLQLKETIKKSFGIEEENRIVSVGAFDKQENQIWATDLMTAIESYSTMSTDFRNKQLRQLRSFLRKDLLRSVNNIKEVLSEFKEDPKLYRINRALFCFDEEVGKLQKSYAKKLNEKYSMLEGDGRVRARELVKNKSPLTKIREVLLGNSQKDYINMENNILTLLYEKNDTLRKETMFQKMNREASINMITEKLGILYEADGEVKRIQGNQGNMEIVTVEEPEKVLKKGYLMKPESSRDLNILLMEETEIKEYESKDYSQSIRLIPAIATVNYATFFNELYLDRREVELKDESHQFKNWSVIRKTPADIGKGFAAAAGIAVGDLSDGTPDIIINAGKALGLSIGTKTALGITGGLAAGALAVGILREINQNSQSDMNQYVAGLHTLRNHFENDYLERYDDYMENIREKLYYRLLELYGVKILDSRIDNLFISVNKVETRITEMEEMINAVSI